jgi:hypothetical protein
MAGATPVLVHNCSGKLGRNLRNNGEVPTTSKPQAHHIVPEKHRLAGAARRILTRHGIDWDSAENGVWLDYGTHRGTFTKDYVRWINDEIVNASQLGGRPAVLDVLSNTKSILAGIDEGYGNGLF